MLGGQRVRPATRVGLIASPSLRALGAHASLLRRGTLPLRRRPKSRTPRGCSCWDETLPMHNRAGPAPQIRSVKCPPWPLTGDALAGSPRVTATPGGRRCDRVWRVKYRPGQATSQATTGPASHEAGGGLFASRSTGPWAGRPLGVDRSEHDDERRMPTSPSAFRWTITPSRRLRYWPSLEPTSSLPFSRGLDRRQRNAGAAAWKLRAGNIVILYDHPDQDDPTVARLITHWRQR